MAIFDEYGAPNQPLTGQERILLAQTQGSADVTTTGTLAMVWTYISNIISGIYAPIVSPALQGTPTAPTAPIGTATQQIATTAFVSESFTDITEPVTINSQVTINAQGDSTTSLAIAAANDTNGANIALYGNGT